jgi:hypothetical protein
MATHLRRSVIEPIREGLTWSERWKGSDKGLIWCWERGRQKRVEDPELALRAKRGELVILAWMGGVEKKLKDNKKKLGTFNYLATWQGLRSEDLNIKLEDELLITCTKTGQEVIFSSKTPVDEDEG